MAVGWRVERTRIDRRDFLQNPSLEQAGWKM
jgi:hypothetical protein